MILVLAQDMVVQVWIPRPCGPFGALCTHSPYALCSWVFFSYQVSFFLLMVISLMTFATGSACPSRGNYQFFFPYQSLPHAADQRIFNLFGLVYIL